MVEQSRHRSILHPGAAAAGTVAAWLAAAAMAQAGTAGATGNGMPQRTLCPAVEERPIHYPREARRRSAGNDPDVPAALLQQLYDLHTAMRYEQAAAVAKRLVESAADPARANYNLAAVLGRLQRTDEALDALDRAVDTGWRDLTHLLIDPDLDTLRNSARYRAMVARLKDLMAQESRGASGQYRESAAIGALSIAGGVLSPEVIADAGLRLLALATLLRHAEAGGKLPANAAGPVIAAPPPQQIVEAVESITGEPLPVSCRRLVLEPLGLQQTALTANDAAGMVVQTTPGDLGLALYYLAGWARCAPPDAGAGTLASLARTMGMSAEPEGPGLRITYPWVQGPLVLRWFQAPPEGARTEADPAGQPGGPAPQQ